MGRRTNYRAHGRRRDNMGDVVVDGTIIFKRMSEK
jgi:hypothetical protein